MSPWKPMGSMDRLRAVLGSPTLYLVAQSLDVEQSVGRPRNQPLYSVLALGVISRLTRSGHRAVTDLADPAMWGLCQQLMTEAIARHGLDLPPPPTTAPRWHHWRRLRDDHLSTDEGLRQLATIHRPLAVQAARDLGLLDPRGPGSLTHPHPTRVLYGDGTIVRPLYAPPKAVRLEGDDGATRIVYPDPITGELTDTPPRRFDPDIAEHHGHTGPVLGHGYVAWHVRGPARYQRLTLALDHVPAPGQEAETSLRLLGPLARLIGPGLLAVAYDGAFTGVHIDQIMTRHGVLALSPMPKDSRTRDVDTTALARIPGGGKARTHPLGFARHDTDFGPCLHQLAAIDGAVAQIDLDDAGDPVVVHWPSRGAVKRSRRSDGRYYFNVGYRIRCTAGGDFDTWLSPHARSGSDPNRPHRLRVIHEHDPDWPGLYPLRSDAESVHSQFKRTLLIDRAVSLGWRRGLVDYYAFALMSNALTEYRWHQQQTVEPARLRRARAGS